MKDIKEYNIITDSDIDNLVIQVNDAIKRGWKPLDGFRSYTRNGSFGVAQTMIKEGEINEITSS